MRFVPRPATIVLVAMVAAQAALSLALRPAKPQWEVLPPVPTRQSLSARAFGDDQFLYRALVLALQNFGDTGGRVTALKDYDMTQVVGWLAALDTLDRRAHHHIGLAVRYFGQTQDRSQLPILIDYIRRHVAADPERKQWWLTGAIMLADKRLDDRELALSLAEQMASYDFPGTRFEALLYPAFVLERLNRFTEAAEVAERLLARHAGRFAPADMDWTRKYLSVLRELARRQAAGEPLPPVKELTP